MKQILINKIHGAKNKYETLILKFKFIHYQCIFHRFWTKRVCHFLDFEGIEWLKLKLKFLSAPSTSLFFFLDLTSFTSLASFNFWTMFFVVLKDISDVTSSSTFGLLFRLRDWEVFEIWSNEAWRSFFFLLLVSLRTAYLTLFIMACLDICWLKERDDFLSKSFEVSKLFFVDFGIWLLFAKLLETDFSYWFSSFSSCLIGFRSI